VKEEATAENENEAKKNTPKNANVTKENGGVAKEEKDKEGPCGLPSKCAIL